jgi:hypothetical protein
MDLWKLGWCFVVLQIGFAFAQNKTGILGTVLDAKTQRPLAYVVVSIQNTNVMQLTAIDGKFNFDDLVRGDQLVLFTVRATRMRCFR